MSQQDLLTEVTLALQQQGIEFLLTGSHASSLQGEARSTHDIDLLVRLTLDDVDSLSKIFPPDRFYLSKSAMQEAIRAGRMFNVLETTTGERIDFWVLTDTAFDQSRFARRQTIQLPGLSLDVSSPEDTNLMKLGGVDGLEEAKSSFQTCCVSMSCRERSWTRNIYKSGRRNWELSSFGNAFSGKPNRCFPPVRFHRALDCNDADHQRIEIQNPVFCAHPDWPSDHSAVARISLAMRWGWVSPGTRPVLCSSSTVTRGSCRARD